MRIREKLRFIKKLAELFDRGEKKRFLLIMAAVLAMSLFQALGVASIFPFISLVMDPGVISESRYLSRAYDMFGFDDARSFTVAAGFAMAGIIVIGNLVSAFAIWLKTRFVWRKSHNLSSRLLERYLSFPYYYFLSQNSSTLERNILMEVQTLTGNFMIPVLEITTDMLLILFVFTALILINPLAAVVIFLLFCLFYGLVFQLGLRNKLKKRGSVRLKENEGRFKAVSEALGGIKDIKVLGREGYFTDRFRRHSLKFSDLLAWHQTAKLLPKYFIEILAFGGVVAFILFLMLTEQNIRQIIPMVSFFAFAGYRILPVMNKMFQYFTQLQFNTAVLDRIHRDLTSDDISALFSESTGKVSFTDKITFRNLSFKYPGSDDYVLDGVNLNIQKDTSVAFAGKTGAGKTTLIDILMGLLTPTSGEMLVDGVKIDDSNVRAWQRNIGYVPQQIYLSDDTLRRNIAFGLPDELIEDEKVERAAKIADLHDFITGELPEGYDTVAGERGIRLSGGQRQRAGIARALYHDPDVLVFDEATSSLDGATEGVVLKAIEDISRMKTIVIIAHRLTTVRKCDIIYLLDGGNIAASGSYDELMRSNKKFRAMGGDG